MTDLNFFLGKPKKFRNICFVYPPTLNDTLDIINFPKYESAFSLSQEEIEDELLGVNRDTEVSYIPTPFEFLLSNCYNSEPFKQIILEAFKFFTHEQVIILPEQKMIIFLDNEESLKKVESVSDLRVINEENYFDFQNLIRAAVGAKQAEKPRPNEDIRVTRIKAKARYRDKIKAKQKGKTNFNDILVSICCMNMGLNPLNIGELSYVAINALVEKYQKKEKYDTDIRSLQAGADAKKIKPKYWIGND